MFYHPLSTQSFALYPLQLALLLIATAAYASFGWGVWRFFKIPPQGIPWRTRVIMVLSSLCFSIEMAFLLLWFDPSRTSWHIGGLILFLASFLLFWATVISHRKRHLRLNIAYAQDSPQAFNQSGVYRYMRHPFYTAYLLSWLGGAVGTLSVTGAIILTGMYAFYLVTSRQEEQQFAQSAWREEYQRYRVRTGRFLPRLF